MQPEMATLSLEDLSRQSPSWVFAGTPQAGATLISMRQGSKTHRGTFHPQTWRYGPASKVSRQRGGKAPTFPRGGLSPSQRMPPTSPRGVLGQGLTPLCAQVGFSLTTHQPPRVTGSSGKAWEGFLEKELGR